LKLGVEVLEGPGLPKKMEKMGFQTLIPH